MITNWRQAVYTPPQVSEFPGEENWEFAQRGSSLHWRKFCFYRSFTIYVAQVSLCQLVLLRAVLPNVWTIPLSSDCDCRKEPWTTWSSIFLGMMTLEFDTWQPLLSAGTPLLYCFRYLTQNGLVFLNMLPCLSQAGFQVVLWLWPGSGRPSCSYCAGPEFSVPAATDAWGTAPFPVNSQHNYKVLVIRNVWKRLFHSIRTELKRRSYQVTCQVVSALFCVLELTEASTCPTLWLMSRWRTTCPESLLLFLMLWPPLPPEP